MRFEPERELVVPQTIISIDGENDTVVPVINMGNQDIVINNYKTPLVRAWRCAQERTEERQIQRIDRSQTKLTPIAVADLEVGNVTPEVKEKLQHLVNTYRHYFATNTRELGESRSTTMKIELSNNQPFTYRPYRMSPAEKNVAKEMVQELLESGIVRESISPFSSPILLVNKKDGKYRMCVDYRKLNNATIKDRYPLPRIDDQIDKLQGAMCFTTLDMISGYHQIPIDENSKHYTAFVTPDGHYEYNKVPFGLCNAPSVFQRMMNRLLAPHDGLATVYLDDILIYSGTPEENLVKLGKIQNIFEEECLTLNPAKCKFLSSPVDYLGYTISAEGVRPGENKSKAIANFPPPKDVYTVHRTQGR